MAGQIGVGSLLGPYRLEKKLGVGSTSEVYLATHTELDRRVALKVLAPELGADEAVFGRFVQEAKTVNAVKNQHIVEIYDVIRCDRPRTVAFVMELVDGPSMKALGKFRLQPAQTVGIALQLMSALGAAHRAGIVHRDLKPDNLIFTTDPRTEPPTQVPRLKVIDFGIAKRTGATPMTAVGQMLGTPAYMAPEQISGDPPSSTASDIFAVGAILYQLWSGERAYPQTTMPDVVRAKLRGEKPDLSRIELPSSSLEAAKGLIDKCLELEPGRRPLLPEVRATLLAIANGLLAGEAAPTGPVPAPTMPIAPVGIPPGPTEVMHRPEPPRAAPAPTPRTVTSMSVAPPTNPIPGAVTEPGQSMVLPEARTEEGLPILEIKTEEVLPIIAAAETIEVLMRETLIEEPLRPVSLVRSYDSIEVLLHQVPAELLEPDAVALRPTPILEAPARIEAPKAASPSASPRLLPPKPGADVARTWRWAILLATIALVVMGLAILGRAR